MNSSWRTKLFDPAPAKKERALVALTIGTLLASFYWGASSSATGYVSDLDQVWYASRALLRGVDPYSVIGPGREHGIDFPLYYPLSAIVAFAPFAALPLHIARTVFIGLSAGLLAYSLSNGGWHRLAVFISGAYASAFIFAQWSPLITAAFLLPWLGPVLLLKPNLGMAIAATSPTRGLLTWSVVGGGALFLASLAIDPAWIPRWLEIVRTAPHFTPPVLLPGGVLILLALLRWRRPEARLLVAMACVPHTTLAYESLPLFLVPRNWRQSLLLAGLSIAAFALQHRLDNRVSLSDPTMLTVFAEWVSVVGTALVILVYLPATIMVLRRSNEGDLPAWVQPIVRFGKIRRPRDVGRSR
jgi:hypothetical protein